MAKKLGKDGIRLCTRYGARGIHIPVMLLVSLSLNILALSIPFLEISMIGKGKIIYDLPRSTWLMWTEGLYVIAILILSFSIIFPILKLAGMFIVWFGPKTLARQERIHGLVRNLGKWSFMDIFVVSLLLALTNKQAFIHSKPMIGVYSFIAAIVLSMITSELLHRKLRHVAREIGVAHEPEDPDRLACPLLSFKWYGWLIGTLLIGSLITLTAAVAVTFLQIHQFLLSSNAYSILRSIESLFQQKQYVVGISMVVFLIVFPFLRVMGTIVHWYSASPEWKSIRRIQWLDLVARWSMLDVFGLALILVLTEGQRMVRTDVRIGLYCLIGAIALTVLLPMLATRLDPTHRRLLR